MDIIVGIFTRVVQAVSSWFTQIMNATGGVTIYITAFVVMLSVSVLLKPLLGSLRSGSSDFSHRSSRGSDKVKNKSTKV